MTKGIHVSQQLLKGIREPAQIKSFSLDQLQQLAAELRTAILAAVEQHGGHMSSNFGTVELTLALHYVFDSPDDALLWDVGHQCYAHKMLTGRLEAFNTLRQYQGLAGFPRREESHHDILNVGHASTAISAALGLLEGRRLGGTGGKVVAIVGDGSLTGGMAFEGLNHAGHLHRNLLVILNDNTMSISRNVGAFSSTLSRLTASFSYTHFRDWFDRRLERVPLVGKPLGLAIAHIKAAIKALLFFRNNFFNNLGFKYVGPFDGHNIGQMIQILKRVARLDEPVLLHLVTKKGRGHSDAEDDPIKFHGLTPAPADPAPAAGVSFTQAFAQALCQLAARDQRVVAITAAMPTGTGLTSFKKQFPDRFYDVGIAEQHGVTLATGMALAGLRPVVAIYSTFMQRAVDQVIHDAALHQLPIIFAMDRSGLVPGDGDTHQGIFDISLFKPLAGVTMLAPAGIEEMQSALDYASRQQQGPIFIRYPKRNCPPLPTKPVPFVSGRGWLLKAEERQTAPVLLCCTGGLLAEALAAQNILREQGSSVDVYNLRFIKPLDLDYLGDLLRTYPQVVVAEDGVLNGGIGQQILSLSNAGAWGCQISLAGVGEHVVPLASYTQLLKIFALDAAGLAAQIRTLEGKG